MPKGFVLKYNSNGEGTCVRDSLNYLGYNSASLKPWATLT